MATASSLRVVRGQTQAATLLHRTRRELIEQLGEPQTAAGLARKLGTSRQRVGYHLRQLEREGLVECVAERRSGNCLERVMRATARCYVISPEALGALGEPTTAGDRLSAAYLISSAAQAVRDVAALDARARAEGKRLSTLTLDAVIRFASPDARAAFAEELTATLARLAARFNDQRAPNGRSYRLTVLAHPAPDGDVHAAAESTPERAQPQADGGGDDA